MANDLKVSYTGSSSPYAIIRRRADGYVWQTTTSTVVTPVSGDIANYDVTLTSLGLDLYAADIPTDLPAGDYAVDFYEYISGSTPTTADFRLTGFEFTQDPSAVASSPSGTNLSTLPLVKDYAGIARTDSSHDTVLTARLQAASRLTEKYTGRLFVSEERTEVTDGYGGFIQTAAYPITAVSKVGIARCGLYVSNTSSSIQQARVSLSSTTMTLVRTASGASTTNTLTLSSYTTITALVAAINAIGSGWVATTSYGDWPVSELETAAGGKSAKAGASFYVFDDAEVDDFDWGETDTIWGAFPRGIRNART